MGTGRRNDAFEATAAFLVMWSDQERSRHEWQEWFADGFLREDRRRLIGFPPADARSYLEHHLAWFEIGDESPTFEMTETVAARGTRLCLTRTRVGYGSEGAAEMLSLCQWDEDLGRLQKVVQFDNDDLDVAVEELERLHVELERHEGLS